MLSHANTEEIVIAAVASPLTMIASDGFDVSEGQGHPRSAGTFGALARAYEVSGRITDAQASVKRAIAIDSLDVRAMELPRRVVR